MRNDIRIPVLVAAAGMIAGALVNPTALQPEASAQTSVQSDIVYLTGIVRDFQASHADFDLSPALAGHQAGNIGLELTENGSLSYGGAGFIVVSEWTDAAGYNMAPHLFQNPNVLPLSSAPDEDQGTVIDRWDSSLGSYGGANIKPRPIVHTGAEMPEIDEPSNLPPNTGNFGGSGTLVISNDLHCDNFVPDKETIIQINGEVTIFCEGNFTLNQRTHMRLGANGQLKLYVRGQFRIARESTINMDTFDPSRAAIYNLGPSSVEINQMSSVCAQVYSPFAPMHLAQSDHFYGAFHGLSVDLDQSSGFHLDARPILSPCGDNLEDNLGVSGGASKGAVNSADTFAHWFRDTLGVNLSAHHTIALRRTPAGVYEYLDDAFFPIDERLYGNDGQAHNYNFTFVVRARFTNRSCTGQFIEFQGTDDCWIFVGEDMGIDLGGVMPGTYQRFDVDRLGLVDGQEYEIALFFAQRQSYESVFRLRTNLDLEVTGTLPSASPEFD